MKEASKALIGEHDFSSFASSRSKKKSHVRTIESISIQENNGLIEIYVKGNGFLYNMVRIIVGTLIEVGLNKINREDVEKILEEANSLINDEKAYAKMSKAINPYGDGKASERIVKAILNYFGKDNEEVEEFISK